MTVVQQKKILEKIVGLENDIEALKKARTQVALSGYASATLSSSGGSKSYTRLDLDKMTNLIDQLKTELTQYRNLLFDGKAKNINTIVTVYS